MVLNSPPSENAQNTPIINGKSIFIEKTLKLLKSRKEKEKIELKFAN